jgi:hypothetical protein
MRSITVFCFMICIICIISSVAISMFLIWGSAESEPLWKSLASLGVCFTGSLLTIGVTAMVTPKLENKSE